jgi:hypothetical protein
MSNSPRMTPQLKIQRQTQLLTLENQNGLSCFSPSAHTSPVSTPTLSYACNSSLFHLPNGLERNESII